MDFYLCVSFYCEVSVSRDKLFAPFKTNFIGFIFSLLISLFMNYFPSQSFEMTLTLAGIQAFIVYLFFFELPLEKKPYWGSFSFLFTLLIILIVVIGSIWIMNHLNYNLMME
jgi:cytochrome o ubiquinol oxidase operon protein cyoD